MGTPLKLLLLEDNACDAELVLHALRRAGYDPVAARVETEQDYRQHLEPAPEIILADFSMPEFDSLRALEIMQECLLDIPFIIVSGTIGEERAVQVMQCGATDYIIKDRLGRLGPAVTQALARWRLKDEKLKAEQAVARLAAIVATSNDAIITKTLDGIITSWNRAAETLYGYSAQEMIGKHISAHCPRGRRKSDAPEDLQENLQRLSNGEHIRAFETVRVRKDGRRVEVLLSISPNRDANGVVTGASAIALDITLRKRSERFLNAEQSVTRILTESKNLEEAGPRVLQTIAECLRWEVAVLWTVDRQANVLRRMHIWHAPWAAANFIEALGQKTVLEPGVGVAGRAWSAGEPVWEPGILIDQQATVGSAMTQEGLRGGFGLPMRHGTELVGVIEFYNPELREPDNSLVAALDNIACQISQFCERRRTEGALRASEEQFRILTDNLPGGIYTCTADGTCDYCNQWWCDYTGLPAPRHMADGWADTLHADDRKQFLDDFAESLRTGQPFQGEYRFRGVDGNYRWFLDRAVRLKNDNGPDMKWFGTCVDIDDRKRAEAERNRLFQRLHLQIERMPLAYILFDADFRITDWNPTAERIFGYSQAEMLGAGPPYKEFVHPSLWVEAESLRRRIHGGDLQAHSLNENLTKDGRTITCEWFNTPLMDDNGQFSGMLCLAQDVTERKSLEAQFRQAQKMEAVGQLAAGVAHDFNNLLTIILGYSELFLGKLPAADPGREFIAQVHSAGERAAVLTHQLLAFARKQILSPVVLDLNALVTGIEKMLRVLIGADIKLLTVLESGLGRVKVDAGQVEQVIMNLAVNARDAMPSGGRLSIQTCGTTLSELQVRHNVELPHGPYTLLTVSDTGSGMDDATKARIFEPFFTTKEVGKGTGLGLATVFGIIKQSGGFIEVDSTLGGGTTFQCYLPQSDEPAQPKEIDCGLVKMPSGMETILLVEDEAGLRGMAQLILQRSGYNVLCAQDGAEALQVCHENAGVVHLLFTDLVMPKMSGRQLSELLAPYCPNMKVLYMSGYTDDTIVRHGMLDAGINFLAKPFTPAKLAQKVRAVLDGAQGAPAIPATERWIPEPVLLPVS